MKIITISIRYIVTAILIGIYATSFAQQSFNGKCASDFVINKLYENKPELRAKREQERQDNINRILSSNLATNNARTTNSTITISVVVHIVLPNPSRVTDEQINAQIQSLNENFAGESPDNVNIPNHFKSLFGKSNIRFCLAPNGIIRKNVDLQSDPGQGDQVKFDALGGSDAVEPNKNLNIWVCKTAGQLLGYSFSPESIGTGVGLLGIENAGVVIKETAFGTGGTAKSPYNLGRTAVHEVGHFLGLAHIWGNTSCDATGTCDDDDGIGDTPKQFTCTENTPVFSGEIIKDDCSPNDPGIMWMNYMDYVDDEAMLMFTIQQHAVMEGSLSLNSWMNGLRNNGTCTATSVNALSITNNSGISIYPNPVNNQFTVQKGNLTKSLNYRIVNIFGQEMSRGILNSLNTVINISNYASGTYYLHTNNEVVKILKK
jgi:hypothetical protein